MPSQCNEQALARLLQEAERLWSGLNSADRLDILQSCADRLGTILLGDNAEAVDFWDLPQSVMELVATDAACREEALRRSFQREPDIETAVAQARMLDGFRAATIRRLRDVVDWPALVRLARRCGSAYVLLSLTTQCGFDFAGNVLLRAV